jgi:hypothetical protein
LPSKQLPLFSTAKRDDVRCVSSMCQQATLPGVPLSP